MNTNNLFQHSVPALENLPAVPKILWYVSAGADFRALSFLSNYNRDHQLKHHGREFSRPDLYVFNGLGPDTDELYATLRNNAMHILFEDDKTRILAYGFQELTLKDEIEQQLNISEEYILDAKKYAQRPKTKVYLFNVTITTKKESSERHKVLYFEHENIDFFKNIILADFFEVTYLCATREGLGYGGCKKSIIQQIYKDAAPNFYIDRGFNPNTLILFNDFTKEVFIDAATKDAAFTYQEDYGYYPCENIKRWRDATVFRLTYENNGQGISSKQKQSAKINEISRK